MVEEEIELPSFGSKVPSPLSGDSGEVLANLASNVFDSGVVPSAEVSGGGFGAVPTPGEISSGDIGIGETTVLPSLAGGTFSKGLSASASAQTPSASALKGEPTMSQVEKVYDATNTCRSNAEIVKLTGLDLATVATCVAWLVKKGWIVVDDNKRSCSIEAMGKLKTKLAKICDLCAR